MVFEDTSAALRASPPIARWAAASRALQAVADVSNGIRAAEAAGAGLDEAAAADASNFVTRLCVAVVPFVGRPVEVADASATFERLHGHLIVEPRPAQCTLYQREVARVRERVLLNHGIREDFAVRLATDLSIDKRQFAVVPAVCRALVRIAESLDTAGRSLDANQCHDAARRLLIGLLQDQPSADTALLCADASLLIPPTDTEGRQTGARTLLEIRNRLRREWHAAAAAAPSDWTDVARRSAAAPAEYRRMLRLLVAAVAAFTLGWGAAIRLAVVLMLSLFRVRRKADSRVTAPPAGPFMLAVVVGALFVWVTVRRPTDPDFAWGAWPALAVVALLISGASLARLVEGTHPGAGARRTWMVALPLLLALAILLTPPIVFARIETMARPHATTVAVVSVLVVALAWFLFARYRRRTSDRRLPSQRRATRGGALWLTFTVAAIALLVAHGVADRAYRNATVRACDDLFAARLGEERRDAIINELITRLSPPSGSNPGAARSAVTEP